MNFTEQQAQEELNKRSKNVTEEDVKKIFEKRDEIEKKFNPSGPLGKFIGDLQILFSLVNDYRKGKYRKVPWTSIAAIVGALLYVFSPIDLIPDFIPAIGLMDDATVVALCLKAIDSDLKKYAQWKMINY